jgi:hypothetical protein
MTKAPLFSCSSFATTKLARAAPSISIAPWYARRHQLPSVRDRFARAYYSLGATGPSRFDRLMMIKLDRLLFLVGVGLLVIGVGISVVVIVVSLIHLMLTLVTGGG